jgi:hypothetical protein
MPFTFRQIGRIMQLDAESGTGWAGRRLACKIQPL